MSKSIGRWFDIACMIVETRIYRLFCKHHNVHVYEVAGLQYDLCLDCLKRLDAFPVESQIEPDN